VESEAHGTDGYQGSRILTLSDAAKAEAVPGLEILSDDVRCSHGVTIGELDPEELFYLRSRGISVREARKVLAEGFLEEALGRIPETDIRKRVRLAVLAKMETMEAVHIRNKTNGPPRSRAEDQGVPP
jgi:Fe-S cluster assembly protein SufD